MHEFGVDRLDEITYHCSGELADMYKLSPFVWREGDRWEMLLRVVNVSDVAAEKVARVHRGTSSDGLHFELGDTPVIAPGREPGAPDGDGCEDPTAACVDGEYFVYYSGWNESAKRGELLLASGPDLEHLGKRGIALPSSETVRNPKEATIVPVHDGTWRLFFEFAQDARSKIGVAAARCADGPWTVLQPLFEARPGWDDWHLSTGPIVYDDAGHPIMFYNGATRDARWRIGWIVFDRDFNDAVERCGEPLVLPGEPRFPGDTDIAFAASAVRSGGDFHLYYSIADRHCMRAVIKSGNTASVRKKTTSK